MGVAVGFAYLLPRTGRDLTVALMVSLSNHEGARRRFLSACCCLTLFCVISVPFDWALLGWSVPSALVVRQAHHEGYW
jgi:hypothetical protein